MDSHRPSELARRTTLALLATAAIVCGALAIRSVASPSGGHVSAVPRVPVFSLQRAPQLLSRLAGDARLASTLDGALADPALGAGSQTCLVVRDDTGRIVYARNPSSALAPASNLKLLTAFAALERMGAATRYRTEALAAGVAAGVVTGDLWIVGSGDPLLATGDFAATAGYQMQPRPSTPLETLADHLVAAGVRQVQGRLMGDEGRYDTQRYAPTWKSTYITDGESGPASALTVNGGFTQWKPVPVPAPSPATNAVSVLGGLLKARGVAVGAVGEGAMPSGLRPVANVESSPLSDVVGVMLQQSDNLAAELTLKELGKRFGAGGTTAAGLAVVHDTLEKAGLPVEEVTAHDGSGLDRADRATCGFLVALLERSGVGPGSLLQAMPLAARDGTLAKRFTTSPAAGRLRAKTGSLEGVTALSGWSDGERNARLVFSLLANGLGSEASGRALEDRLGTAVSLYPQAPDPATLAP